MALIYGPTSKYRHWGTMVNLCLVGEGSRRVGLGLEVVLQKVSGLLGGSWVVITGVISKVNIVITQIRGLIAIYL